MIKILGLFFLMLLSSCNHNVSNFKELVIKDGDTIVAKAYYNTIDNTWYDKADTKSAKKTELNIGNKTYKVKFLNDSTQIGEEKTVDDILFGCGKDDEVIIPCENNVVSLNGVKITDNTEYTAIYRGAKVSIGFVPQGEFTKKGFTHNGWYNRDDNEKKPFIFSTNEADGDKIYKDTIFDIKWEKNVEPTLYKLTVKGDGRTVDTAYYDPISKMWYNTNEENKEQKSAVLMPDGIDRAYRVSFDFNGDGREEKFKNVLTTFIGYGKDVKAEIFKGASDNVPLDGYSITEDTELVTMWDKVLLGDVEPPTKEGSTFIGWFSGDVEYNAQSPITSDITLTARWRQIAYKTLKLSINEENDEYNEIYYYGDDKKWYSKIENGLLLTKNRVSDIKDRTLGSMGFSAYSIFQTNNPTDTQVDDFSFSPYTFGKVENGELKRDNTIHIEIIDENDYVDKTTHKIKVDSIDDDVIVLGRYIDNTVGENISMTSNNPKYTFGGWYVKVNDIIENIADYKLKRNMTVVFSAKWNEVSQSNPEQTQTVDNVKKLYIHNSNDMVLATAYYKNGKWYSDTNTTNEIFDVMVYNKSSSHSLMSREEQVHIVDETRPPKEGRYTTYYYTFNLSGFGVGGEGKLRIGGEVKANATEDNQKNLYCVLTGCSITEDTHLYEIWKPNYLSNNGKVQRPQYTPSKERHTFTGWFKSGENTPFDFENTIVDSSFTIEARFTPIATE